MTRIAIALFFFFIRLSVTAQVIDDSVLIEGHYRVFHYNPPAQSLHRPALIFVLHGSGGNGRMMMQPAEAMEQQASRENAIVVYPDGYKNFWNECRKAAPSAANRENINEQAFFSAMIDYFEERYSINTDNIFAVGTSGGGHMVYKLALTMPQKFRAITAIIANLPDSTNMDCAAAGKPVAVMIINGTDDNINPYDGGEVILDKNMSMGFVCATDKTFRYWATLAGYGGEPSKEKVPNTDPGDGRTIERFTYKQEGKPEIVLLKVIGGKHDYPHDIDVHQEAWAFFKRQMKS